MGDLKGHAIPGSFFLVYGMWWAVGCLWKYLSSRRSETLYVSTISYRMTCFSGFISRLPTEAFIKISLSSSGIIGELITHLPTPSPAIVQHATMYFFFLLSGIVDLCSHYGLPLPHGVDYSSMVLALTVEGLLFVTHIHGRTLLDIHLHMLLIYVIATTVIVIILEMKFQKSVILGMARAYLMMLHGSWFWAVGIILYSHESTSNVWDENSEENVMQATIYFCWHCAVHLILFVVLTLTMSYCYNRNSDRTILSHKFTVSKNEQNYVAFHQMNNGVVDSDDEFETILPSIKS